MRSLTFLNILLVFVKGKRASIFFSIIELLILERFFLFSADIIKEEYDDANQRVRKKVDKHINVCKNSLVRYASIIRKAFVLDAL